jgi:hypothetical protein
MRISENTEETVMEERELPANLQNMLLRLRKSSATISCDIEDVLNNANCVEDFKERVSHAMDSLIGEAESVKKMFVDDKQQESTLSESLTVDDARQIAFETLRVVSRLDGWGSFKDLVGRELDITDEMLDQAVGLLFSEDK